jgi:hypothetical protein
MTRYVHGGVSDQRTASDKRWQDALALKEANRWLGAMYMAGYALEWRLKFRLMEKYGALNLKALEQELKKRFRKKTNRYQYA